MSTPHRGGRHCTADLVSSSDFNSGARPRHTSVYCGDIDVLKYPVCCSCMFKSMRSSSGTYPGPLRVYWGIVVANSLGRHKEQSSCLHLTGTPLGREAKSLTHERCVMHDNCGEPEKQVEGNIGICSAGESLLKSSERHRTDFSSCYSSKLKLGIRFDMINVLKHEFCRRRVPLLFSTCYSCCKAVLC